MPAPHPDNRDACGGKEEFPEEESTSRVTVPGKRAFGSVGDSTETGSGREDGCGACEHDGP
jgi:hypothetical protein